MNVRVYLYQDGSDTLIDFLACESDPRSRRWYYPRFRGAILKRYIRDSMNANRYLEEGDGIKEVYGIINPCPKQKGKYMKCPKCVGELTQVYVSMPIESVEPSTYPYEDKLVWWCPKCKIITGEIDVNISSSMLNRIAH